MDKNGDSKKKKGSKAQMQQNKANQGSKSEQKGKHSKDQKNGSKGSSETRKSEEDLTKSAGLNEEAKQEVDGSLINGDPVDSEIKKESPKEVIDLNHEDHQTIKENEISESEDLQQTHSNLASASITSQNEDKSLPNSER